MIANPSGSYPPLTRAALQRSNALHAAEGFVYFIADAEREMVKIGRARNVRRRFNTLQTSSAGELTFLGCLAGGVELERELHDYFGDERVRGEWFRYTAKVRELVRDAYRAATNREVGDAGDPLRDPAPKGQVGAAFVKKLSKAQVDEFAYRMGLERPQALRYLKDLAENEARS